MPTSKARVEELLRTKLHAQDVRVEDVSANCGAAFEVRVVSETFEGKNRIAIHRMIHDALEEVMGEIHALSIKSAKTPKQAAAMAEEA